MNKFVMVGLVCALLLRMEFAAAQETSPAVQSAGKPQGTKFLEESVDGAPLVGLEVGLFELQSTRPAAAIYSLRPIWQTPTEREVGPLFGVKGIQTIRLEAPPGCIVTSVIANVEGDQLKGLRLVYSPLAKEEKVAEPLLSRWVGGRAGEDIKLTGNGQPITALEGAVTTTRVVSLGVRFGAKAGEKPAGDRPAPFVPTAEYAAALKEVESWKVTTLIEEDKPGRPIRALLMQERTLTPQKLEIIGRLGSLEELSFLRTFGGIKAEHVTPLTKLPALRSLDVSNSYWFDDSHLLALRDLKTIVNLNVFGTRVTGGGISQIRGWKNLTHLTVSSRFIEDSTMNSLSRMPWLEHIVLHDTAVSGDGLRRLEAVKGLKTLRVFTRHMTDEAFQVLKQLPNVTDVAVNGGSLTDGAFDATSHLQLKTLSISAELKDNGLRALAKQTAVTEFRMINYGPVEVDLAPLKEWKKLSIVLVQEGQLVGDGFSNLSADTMKEIQLIRCTLTDENISQLSTLQNLEALAILGSRISDDAVAHLGKMKKLKVLMLRQCNLGDAALAHLNDMPNLVKLDLGHNNLTGAGVQHVTGSPLLAELNLESNRVVDDSLEHIGKLVSLQKLNLDITKISDAGLSQITGLQKLEALHVARNRLTDASLQHLAKLSAMQDLNLAGMSLTDDSLLKLKPLTKLTMLGLSNTGVTNAGIPHLDDFTELRVLYADTTRLNEQGTKRARQKRPHLEVWRNSLDPDRF